MQIATRWGAIFDMDGVIVDSRGAHLAAVRALCREHGLRCSRERFEREVFGIPNRVWLPRLFGRRLTPTEFDRLSEEKETHYRSLLAQTVTQIPGIHDLLHSLRRRGVPCALASSAPRGNVRATLRETGLGSFFGPVLWDLADRPGKPDPSIFLEAARGLGLAASSCVVFEDSLVGVEAGRRAGCLVVGLTTTHSAAALSHADLVVDRLGELDPMKLARRVRAHTLSAAAAP